MNIRRRVYDTLNVLYASDLLIVGQKDDRFRINPRYTNLLKKGGIMATGDTVLDNQT